MGTPESRLPVCAGMDALARGRLVEEAVDDVDLVLERLERLQGFAELHLGARALAPTSGRSLMPLPMNRTAKRFGNAGAASWLRGGGTPQAGSDSSHGRAIVTPTPRRKVRRGEAALCILTRLDHDSSS